MTEPFLIRPEILDGDRRRRAVEGLRAAQVTLPSWSELADPARIPAAIVSSLKSVGPDEPDAKNLWRVHWFNDVDRRDRVPVPGYVVLPEALTGVKAPVVVLLGRRFPLIGAHKVLAAYACLVPRLVTGQFAPAGQGHLRRPQAFDRPSAAIAVKDFRPDEEWFRHGPMRLLSIDCSRSANRVVVFRRTIRRYHKLVSMLEQ